MELFSCLLALSYFFISSSQLFWRSCNCVKCERTVSLNDNNSKNYFTAKHFKTSDSINLPPNLVSVKFHLFSDFLSYFLRFSSRTYPGTTLSIFWLVFERRCVICTDIKAFFFILDFIWALLLFCLFFVTFFYLTTAHLPCFLKFGPRLGIFIRPRTMNLCASEPPRAALADIAATRRRRTKQTLMARILLRPTVDPSPDSVRTCEAPAVLVCLAWSVLEGQSRVVSRC